MKIKLVGRGWQGFTGYFGATEFANGVSVRDVSDVEARRVAASVAVETLEGTNPSAAQQIIDSRTKPMEIATTVKTEAPVQEKPAMHYSVAELEAIADKGGIRALRNVADGFGVKGKSITELINGLRALAPKEVEPEVAEKPEEPAQAEPEPAQAAE